MQPIILCRLISGDRTAVWLACGLIAHDRHGFAIATAAAGIIWAL